MNELLLRIKVILDAHMDCDCATKGDGCLQLWLALNSLFHDVATRNAGHLTPEDIQRIQRRMLREGYEGL